MCIPKCIKRDIINKINAYTITLQSQMELSTDIQENCKTACSDNNIDLCGKVYVDVTKVGKYLSVYFRTILSIIEMSFDVCLCDTHHEDDCDCGMTSCEAIRHLLSNICFFKKLLKEKDLRTHKKASFNIKQMSTSGSSVASEQPTVPKPEQPTESKLEQPTEPKPEQPTEPKPLTEAKAVESAPVESALV